MQKIGRFFKSALKWGAILGGIYLVATLFQGFDFETRAGWFLFGLSMAVAYVDGSHKDRIAALEWRIEELERELLGYRHR